MVQNDRDRSHADMAHAIAPHDVSTQPIQLQAVGDKSDTPPNGAVRLVQDVRRELLEIRELLLSAP